MRSMGGVERIAGVKVGRDDWDNVVFADFWLTSRHQINYQLLGVVSNLLCSSITSFFW